MTTDAKATQHTEKPIVIFEGPAESANLANRGVGGFRVSEDNGGACAKRKSEGQQTHSSGSTADRLVRLALGLYRIGRTQKDEPFAVKKDGPNLALMFRGSRDELRNALAHGYHKAYGKVPKSAALTDALTVLQGKSLEAEPEVVHLRVADHDGAIVVDLGDAKGRAVIIEDGDWHVAERSPVLFRRTALTGKLPTPVRGGDLLELRELLNVSDETWPLMLGWLISCFQPDMPHPILMLGGQQGTGKTTAATKLVGLVDPSPAPMRSNPKDMEAWAVPAAASWLIAVDNVSFIPDWWSDSLCKCVTGDGVIRRQLYTDGDVTVMSFRRPVLLTSIDPGSLRGDLGDRALLVDLEPIDDANRRSEREIERAYLRARPRVFGALLDLLAAVLEEVPNVHLELQPRMADFAVLLAAMDEVQGTTAVDTYLDQRTRIAETVVDSDPVALAIVDLLEKHACGAWFGTPTKLLGELTQPHLGRPPKGWPRSPQNLGSRIRRAEPALRQLGIEVEHYRSGKQRTIALAKAGDDEGSASEPANDEAETADSHGSNPEAQDIWLEGDNGSDPVSAYFPHEDQDAA